MDEPNHQPTWQEIVFGRNRRPTETVYLSQWLEQPLAVQKNGATIVHGNGASQNAVDADIRLANMGEDPSFAVEALLAKPEPIATRRQNYTITELERFSKLQPITLVKWACAERIDWRYS